MLDPAAIAQRKSTRLVRERSEFDSRQRLSGLVVKRNITRDYGSRVGGSIPSEAAALSSFKGKDTRLRTVKCAFDSRREHQAFEAPVEGAPLS